MRLVLLIAAVPLALLTACVSHAPPHADGMPTLATAAVAEATAQHASALARASDAGLWIAQDAKGKLIASGVLDPMPNAFDSDDLYTVFPRRAGERIEKFGFARSKPIPTRGSVPMLYAEYRVLP